MIVLGFVISESLSLALGEALRDQPDIARWTFILSPARTIASMVNGLFPDWETADDHFVRDALLQARVMVAVMAVCSLAMFARYQRHD